MTWNVMVPPVLASAFAGAVDAAQLPAAQPAPANNEAEVAEQLAVAKEMAKLAGRPGALYADGAVAYLHATLSGHANPGHEPPSGAASDVVSVTVQRAAVTVPPPAPDVKPGEPGAPKG